MPEQVNTEQVSQGAAYQVQIIISILPGSGTCELFRNIQPVTVGQESWDSGFLFIFPH